ncbi:MAG: hypothetical protein C5B51_04360 [Terriglobia bacterium]|nr:MAG: hypothetical protein C5B51_04360 [Terriglobia bacterium]
MRALLLGLLLAGTWCIQGRSPARRTYYDFLATAFSRNGITADGIPSQVGIVAADPAVLPLGTRVRVSGAGMHSGIYTVRDTGSKVDGRHIDIYMPSRAAAKRFGKRRVRVTVLKWGDSKK